MSIVKVANARLSFPKLYKAEAYPGNDDKVEYSATLMFDMKDKRNQETRKKIKAAAKAAAEEKWGSKIPKNLQLCFGDNSLPMAKNKREEYEGHFVLKVKRRVEDGRPNLRDQANNPTTEEDALFYGGCFVAVSFNFYPWDNTNGKGLNANLRAVMFLRHGEEFSKTPRSVPDDEFDGEDYDDFTEDEEAVDSEVEEEDEEDPF